MTTRSERDLRAAYASLSTPGDVEHVNRFIDHLAAPPARKTRRALRLAPLGAAAGILAFAIVLSVTGAHDHAQSHGPAGGPALPPAESSPVLPPAESSPVSTTPAQSAALTQWADFPVNASPRPVVLTGPAVIDPASGFVDGADKLAYLSGNFVLATSVPSSPPTADGQPVITASDALGLLQAPPGGGPKSGTAVQITNIQLGTSIFSTDRGPQTLPSWTFTFAGVADPANVLAIPAADRWPHTGTPTSDPLQLTVTIPTSEHQATLSFLGAPPGSGPCEANYEAEIRQSTSAVLVSIHEVSTNRTTAPGSTTMCFAIGYRRMLTVPIAPAIGNRVLIADNGAALPSTAG